MVYIYLYPVCDYFVILFPVMLTQCLFSRPVWLKSPPTPPTVVIRTTRLATRRPCG